VFLKDFDRRPLFGFKKKTTNPHILAHANEECLDDGYPKLKIYISKLVLDSYKYIAVAYVTMICMV
jgi:hypothetical protein